MRRVFEIIDSNIASLEECADRWDRQPGNPSAPMMSAVHRFAAATLGDVRKQIVEKGGVTHEA